MTSSPDGSIGIARRYGDSLTAGECAFRDTNIKADNHWNPRMLMAEHRQDRYHRAAGTNLR